MQNFLLEVNELQQEEPRAPEEKSPCTQYFTFILSDLFHYFHTAQASSRLPPKCVRIFTMEAIGKDEDIVKL
jgi:hypothetical protein